MTPDYVLFHYDEIGLKGGNRSYFERKLKQNIKAVVPSGTFTSIKSIQGRLVGKLSEVAKPDFTSFKPSIEKVFGLAYFAPAVRCTQNEEIISKTAVSILNELTFSTFRITARRSGLDVPLSSQKLNENVGALVVEALGKKVKLKNPDAVCHIDLFDKSAFLYTDKISGPGGLPIGVSGKVMCMISGGIDSPLAAYYTMKRGGKISLVHFHSVPYTNSASIDKGKEIVGVLQQYQPRIVLHSVPLADIQKQVRTDTDEKYRVLMYRGFMIRITEMLSNLEKAKAIVTGEVLGQVASQTLENMQAVEDVSSVPILRPLVGFDKREIVDQTKQLGTFDISIQPDQDCCSLFVPKHPATKARLKDVEHNESRLDVDTLVKEAVNQTEKFVM